MLLGSRAWIWLFVGFAFAWQSPARAEAPVDDRLPIHVLGVKSDDALDQAEALTFALRKAVRSARGWSLGSSSQSLEFLALEMGCQEPIDPTCETRIAQLIRADRFIWSTIRLEGKTTVVGSVNLFVRGKGTNSAPLSFSANLTDPTSDALQRLASHALKQVTGGAPRGRLKVSAGGVAAQVFIDDKPMGALAAAADGFQLPMGDHRVSLKAPGYLPAHGTATVRPEATVELTLSLAAIPQEKSTDMRLIGGLGAIGGGVVAGAVGLWATLEVGSIRQDPEWERFRAQIPQGEDACDVATSGGTVAGGGFNIADISDKCDRAATFEVVQAVMYPVAAVSVGVGIYLLGTSGLAEDQSAGRQRNWSIAPIITPELQAVSVGYRF